MQIALAASAHLHLPQLQRRFVPFSISKLQKREQLIKFKYHTGYHHFNSQLNISSPVVSNSTQGTTLAMNLRNISKAKCDYTLCPDQFIESDMLLRTAACRQGWTVGMVTFQRKGNFYIVRVLSRYSRWMSQRMSQLLTGVPSLLLALKNIRGVWQYSSQMMYILQQRKFSSFYYSISNFPAFNTVIYSPFSSFMTSSSSLFPAYSGYKVLLSLLRERLSSSNRYCWVSLRQADLQLGLSDGIHFQAPHILIRWSPAFLNSLGDSSPLSWKTSPSGGGLSFLPISC